MRWEPVTHGDARWALVHGDALEVMQTMPAGCADAIVTSPPFGDQRRYGSFGRVTENRRSRRQRREVLNGYVDWARPFLAEMLRVVSPTGSLMLNLGRVMRNGEQHPYHLEVLLAARELGWRWIDEVVWVKPNALTFSHPTYLASRHEFVWWLAPNVDAVRTYHGGYPDSDAADFPWYDPTVREPHKAETERRVARAYKQDRNDERYSKRGYPRFAGAHTMHPDGARPSTVVTVAVGGERGVKHPAVMARDTARYLVRLCCPVGGVVLDPFAGSCTTGVVALPADRRFVGIEAEAEYLPEGRSRLVTAAEAGVQEALA